MIKIFSNYSLMPATLIRRQFENIKCKKKMDAIYNNKL